MKVEDVIAKLMGYDPRTEIVIMNASIDDGGNCPCFELLSVVHTKELDASADSFVVFLYKNDAHIDEMFIQNSSNTKLN